LIFTAMVVFCCSTLAADSPRTAPPAAVVEVKSSGESASAEDAKPAKPDAPAPKLTSEETESAGGGAVPSSSPLVSGPVQPATADSYETPRKRAIWYSLIAAGHGTAAFDAWTTRKAITGGYGVEGDPFERPFAHSDAIYATTQVTPLVMDYVGYRMMRSRYSLFRKFWWIPQTTSASVSLGAGIHNYRIVH
jgi:hypothetical protein